MADYNQNFNDLFRLIDIYQVISSKVKLNKKGANFWGICPFHNDENPSMSVSVSKGIFKCFSCNASGNAITFLEKLDHLNFMQALTECLKLSGADQQIIDNLSKHNKITLFQKIYSLNQYAATLMNDYLLLSEKYPLVNKFLVDRKITSDTINSFKLGYLDKTHEANFKKALTNYIQETFKDEVADDLLQKSQLFVYNPETKQSHLFFNERIIFPIIDEHENVIGFGGRDVTNNAMAKYLNSQESKYFIKGNHLYHYYQTNFSQDHTLIIVEGYMDCITLVQNHYQNTVATMGTALTSNQMQLIFSNRDLKKIVLSFDNDSPGIHAFINNLTLLLNYEINQNFSQFIPIYLSGLHYSKCKDPDELFKSMSYEDAKTIYDQFGNGLYWASIFMLTQDENFDYNLNQSLIFLLKYQLPSLGIYAITALNLFKQYLIDKYKLDAKNVDDLINNLKHNVQVIKPSFSSVSVTNNNSSHLNLESATPKAIPNKLLFLKQQQTLGQKIHMLYHDYLWIICIYFLHPYVVKAFKKNATVNPKMDEIVNSDEKFRKIITQIKKKHLKELLSNDLIAYQEFACFGFLLYIYFDENIINDFHPLQLQSNLNCLLATGKSFFSNLEGDDLFADGKYLHELLQNDLLRIYHDDISLRSIEKIDNLTIEKNLTKAFITIVELLLSINSTLSKINKLKTNCE